MVLWMIFFGNSVKKCKRLLGWNRKIFEKEGTEGLAKYSKMHFKTFKEITGGKEKEENY
jgi:ribonuclease HIII